MTKFLDAVEQTGNNAKLTHSPTLPPKAVKTPTFKAKKRDTQVSRGQVSNITILHLNAGEIEELKNTAYVPQTYRLTRKDIEWVKDTAYRLNKEMTRGKVTQGDILRLAIKFFENLLATNKKELVKILKRLK